ncbi:hypothetical protein B0I29_10335 [Actinoplanes lutulentus]|uniref:Uncharacterized protein n=1 Tax=Actinoplanes lutulentus TaxID=1287878 RepID=A0A327ZF62_9ACTN|nr:hypothetical protein B0I29_10335 [Actinoplanes lutulentus]
MTSPCFSAGPEMAGAAVFSGAALNHIAGNSKVWPGRYRRVGLARSELLKTSVATVPMTAAGMITKTRTVLITDN